MVELQLEVVLELPDLGDSMEVAALKPRFEYQCAVLGRAELVERRQFLEVVGVGGSREALS